MRFIWILIHLILSTGILSIPILILGWFDRDKNLIGKISRLWARWIIWSMGISYKIGGTNNLCHKHQYVFMCNHESVLDILLALACLPHNIVFLAKKELFRIPVFGWTMKAAGMIKVDRENKEKAKKSVDQAINKLSNAKYSTILFPEGTRSESGDLLTFKKGGFIMAIRFKLPVVPITIIGARSILPKKSLKLNKGNIYFIIDIPIDTANMQEKDKNRLLAQCRDTILKNKKKYHSKNIQNDEYFSTLKLDCY